MLDLLTHLELLSRAAEHIARSEVRRARQVRHLACLRAAGRQTRHAEAHLRGLEQNLTKWRRSETAIRWSITLLRDAGPPHP